MNIAHAYGLKEIAVRTELRKQFGEALGHQETRDRIDQTFENVDDTWRRYLIDYLGSEEEADKVLEQVRQAEAQTDEADPVRGPR